MKYYSVAERGVNDRAGSAMAGSSGRFVLVAGEDVNRVADIG